MKIFKNIFFKVFYCICILLLCCVCFSCATFSPVRKAEISYVVDEKEPVRDDSFFVKSESNEAFTMEFDEEKRETFVDFLVGKNIIPPSKNRRIVCYGTLSEVVVKNNKDRLSEVREKLFPRMKKKYRWDGFVSYDGSEKNIRLNIKVRGKNAKRLIYVRDADCGLISVDVKTGFGSKEVDTPFKIASVHSNFDVYDIYAVKNKNYLAFGKDSLNENLVRKNMPKISVRELLNLKGQVFQIIDSNKNVVAECKADRYRIFIEPSDEKYASLVETAGFICTYLNVMNRVDSIKKVE